VPAVQALQVGDPADDATDLSSLIAPDEAKRVQEWLDEARTAGATVVTGGTVEGGVVMPTVLTDVDVSLRVSCQEIFAPVINIQPYHDFADAIQEVNHSKFGLQAGVFTQDIARIWQAYEQLDVGGVIVNDVPTWRIDHMPYGGVKQSGFGREGLRYAIEELTEPKLLVLNLG
jgi:acyl-CoA reductase-like NAD-dependent aldehyde dehydrogenase